MDAALDLGASPDAVDAPPDAMVDVPVASPNTFAALPKAPVLSGAALAMVVADVAGLVPAGRSSQYTPRIPTTITAAPTDACHGAAGSAAKRGMLRSHGDITTREANVVSIPAKNQNNGIKSPENALTPKTVVPTQRSDRVWCAIVILLNRFDTMCAKGDTFARCNK
jgi:hypothetical protein